MPVYEGAGCQLYRLAGLLLPGDELAESGVSGCVGGFAGGFSLAERLVVGPGVGLVLTVGGSEVVGSVEFGLCTEIQVVGFLVIQHRVYGCHCGYRNRSRWQRSRSAGGGAGDGAVPAQCPDGRR